MNLKQDVEAELKRNEKFLEARVNRPSGFQFTSILKGRILFARMALRSGEEEVMAEALSKLRRTDERK